MTNAERLNKHIDKLLSYWKGEITEDELSTHKDFVPITEEIDKEMQKDSFY